MSQYWTTLRDLHSERIQQRDVNFESGSWMFTFWSKLSSVLFSFAFMLSICFLFFFCMPFQWINDEVPREPESFLFAHRHEAMSDLIYLLGQLVDVKGKILVPGINDNVAPLTDGERATYTDIDFDKVHFVTIIESKMLLRASFSCWDSFSHRTTTVPHLPKFSPLWTNWNNLLVQFVEAFQILRLWEGGGFCDFVPNQWSSTNK